MAWSDFTTYLAPGGELTIAMRAELWAAFDERLQAIGGLGLEAADMAAITASALTTAKVRYRAPASPGSVTVARLDTAIESLAARFAASESAPALWTASTLRAAALAAEGLTSTQWGQITTAVNAGLDSRQFWNVCRRMLRQLDILRIPVSGAISTWGRGGPVQASPAAAAAAYAASADFAAASTVLRADMTTRWTSAPGWGVDASGRSQATFAVPTGTPFSSYDIWVFRLFFNEYATEVVGDWGSAAYSFSVPAGSTAGVEERQVIALAEAQTGPVLLTSRCKESLDMSALEARLTAQTGISSWSTSVGLGADVFLRPTWAYEAGA